MKIFISADIEGVTGVTTWEETDLKKPESSTACAQMTAEVAAACEGALQAGATDLWVKDAHDTGTNLIASRLPREARLSRAWGPSPFIMLEELDDTFQGIVLIGYHSRAGANTSPLAHTLTGNIDTLRVNDRDASEFLLSTYIAAMLKVPVCFVSGDKGLCDEATQLNPRIETVAVKEGIGSSTVSIHPDVAVDRIRAGVAKALKGNREQYLVPLPEHFSVEIRYRHHFRAYRYSFYPGAKKKDARTITFDTDNFYEVMRMFLFVVQ